MHKFQEWVLLFMNLYQFPASVLRKKSRNFIRSKNEFKEKGIEKMNQEEMKEQDDSGKNGFGGTDKVSEATDNREKGDTPTGSTSALPNQADASATGKASDGVVDVRNDKLVFSEIPIKVKGTEPYNGSESLDASVTGKAPGDTDKALKDADPDKEAALPSIDAVELYDYLLSLAQDEATPLTRRYLQLRDLLERLCRASMQNKQLQLTDLAARISYLAATYGLSRSAQNRLHTFRLTSNAVMNLREEPTRENLMRDIRTLTLTIKTITQSDIPQPLYVLLPQSEEPLHASAPLLQGERIRRMRVCFQYADQEFLYVNPVERTVDEPIRVRYNVEGLNSEFAETVDKLWPHAQLNLLDVMVSAEGVHSPALIVLEPDYLIDISSLAECFKEYGAHPANYLLGKLRPPVNSRHILLGNIANLFLDEWIHAKGEVDYLECMAKVFRTYPLELATCDDLLTASKANEFSSDCRKHFENIRQIVLQTFHDPGYKLNREDAVLEPSYVCEALGLQGRLDYMQRDMSSFIEMKSGKGDEYFIPGKVVPKENHKVQMLLYQAVLQFSMGKDHRHTRAFLLYTRYPLLYPAKEEWAQVRRAINLRNLIVANEYAVQLHNNPAFTASIINDITPEALNLKGLRGRYWECYLAPSVAAPGIALARLTPLEREYFLTLYNFIVKEHYTSKSGDMDYDGRAGAAALWLASLTEKREAGEILYDLIISENRATDAQRATVTFDIPLYEEEEFLPNFRVGDVVQFYERNRVEDNATNKMVFKGSIAEISATRIVIRIRATQRNPSVLPAGSTYAVEHDTMDTSYKSMYQALTLFASANEERRRLLLGQRPPRFDKTFDAAIAAAPNDFVRVALKARAAKDFFLLVGPPGTGKTSRALRRMVESFHDETPGSILLLAYTNRAVDEICKSISEKVDAEHPENNRKGFDYIRVGSELSCEERFRGHLLENVLEQCTRRTDVVQRLTACRIFVGTVASLSTKTDLFQLKHFDVAIIDEATQILEPQLLGILSARDWEGRDAVDRFIMIGDHKQLPAVVLQGEEQSRVASEALRSVGITNLKDSLFERLYRFYTGDAEPVSEEAFSLKDRAVDMLCRQGRMNPAVATFPNQAFYGGRLQSVGLPHQLDESCPYGPRVQFIPSEPQLTGLSGKSNQCEARIAARIATEVYYRNPDHFDTLHTLGIITPYRSQIALIRKELEQTGIPALQEIMVDTVERFQGSERDVIIYSFSVNYAWQIPFLSNIIREDGVLIDRKLNVALTRARQQMYIIGVPQLLKKDKIYEALINLTSTMLH